MCLVLLSGSYSPLRPVSVKLKIPHNNTTMLPPHCLQVQLPDKHDRQSTSTEYRNAQPQGWEVTDSGPNSKTENTKTHRNLPQLRRLKHNADVMSLHEGSLLLQLLFTYKCSQMWSKVHFFFFSGFVCNKTSGNKLQAAKNTS